MSKTDDAMRGSLLGGLIVTGTLVLGVGGWAASADISGAVIAPGQLVVEGNAKKVQHPTGGVVGQLLVREGDFVRAGQTVLKLDETVTRANYEVVSKSIDELAVRRMRLVAEQDGADALILPEGLLSRGAELEALVQAEQKLFLIRRSARQGQKQQLQERVNQLSEQIAGMTIQAGAKGREIELIGRELRGVRDLFNKKLIPISRMTALERDAARLEGERGSLISSIAQTKGRITETEQQILQIDQDLRADVGRELADVRAKLSELAERRIAAEDQLKRVELRAPQDGVVHQLATHTVGGVIAPSEAVMLIVPNSDDLRVEVRIAPQDIDHVRIGHDAILRFSAFNQQSTPEIGGKVAIVAADVSQDKTTGFNYYTVRVTIPPEEMRRLEGLTLTPGMPVECFIKTGSRSVISYLVKPLSDHFQRAFRER